MLPAPVAPAVFAGLGLGMALPFLLIAFVPALQRLLPRPGAWMETFRRLLAIPMLLTAVALTWVLGRQGGIDAMAVGLIIAMLAATVLRWLGVRQHRNKRAAVALAPVAAALLATLGVELPTGPATAATVSRAAAIRRSPGSSKRTGETRSRIIYLLTLTGRPSSSRRCSVPASWSSTHQADETSHGRAADCRREPGLPE